MIKRVLRVSIIVLSSVLLLALGTNVPGFAQTGSWSEPINVSNTPNGSWFPDLAVDHVGNVHVVWCETEWDEFQTGTEYLFYSQRNSRGWTQPNDLVAASDWIHRNSIAVDTLGNLYLTFLVDDPPRYNRGIYLGQAPVDTAYSAASWSDGRFIGGRRMGYVSDVVVDEKNWLHVIYTESPESDPLDLCPRGGCSELFYRNSQDGGRFWSAPVNLSKSGPGTKRIGLMVDGQGRIHAFWDEGGDRYMPDVPIGVAHTVSYDGGLSWSAPVLITSTWEVPQQITAGVSWSVPVPITSTREVPQQITAGFDGRGQTVIVWRTVTVNPDRRRDVEELVYYQVSSDGISWSAPTPIPGILASEFDAQYDVYDMATDSAGNLHFVGAVRLSASDLTPGIFHLQWDGERWSAPERVSTGSGYPEYPRIVVENGNVLHVVWAVRESAGYNPQHIDVWYSTKQLASPAWTPVPTPEPLSTPTVTALPSPVPAVTPYPTVESVSTGPPAGLYTESDEVLQLMAALSPIALLVLVIVAVRLGWLKRLFR